MGHCSSKNAEYREFEDRSFRTSSKNLFGGSSKNLTVSKTATSEYMLKENNRDGTFRMKVNDKESIVAWDGVWMVPKSCAELGDKSCQGISHYLRPVVRFVFMYCVMNSYDEI
jgi:hypothetical protein